MKKPNFAAMNPVVAEAIKQMMAEQGDKFSLEKINLSCRARNKRGQRLAPNEFCRFPVSQ